MGFAQHGLHCAQLLLLLIGPAPLALIVTQEGRRATEKQPWHEGMLLFLSTWCLLQGAIAILLGILHQLTLGGMLVAEALLLMMGSLAASRFPKVKSHRLPKVKSRSIDAEAAPQVTFSWRLEMMLFGAIISVGMILLKTIATSPITDYDSLAYHLPAMAQWYQDGWFSRVEQFQENLTLQGGYPYTWEALCALFLLPFREDFLVALPNMIAWLLLGLGTLCLSIELGATFLRALAASCLVLLFPIVLENADSMRIDLPFAAFFVVGLSSLFIYRRSRSAPHIAIFVASLGMLAGIKPSGIPYGGLLALVFVVAKRAQLRAAQDTTSSLSQRAQTHMLLVAIACALFLGSFWYVRNFILFGNPLGAIRTGLGPVTLFPGALPPDFVQRTMLAHVFQPGNAAHWRILWAAIEKELRLSFFLPLLLLSLLLFPSLFRREASRRHPALLLLSLVAATGLLYLYTPFSGANVPPYRLSLWMMGQAIRYAFPFLAVLAAAAAVGGTTGRITETGLAAVALCAAVIALYERGGISGLMLLVPIWFSPHFLLRFRWLGGERATPSPRKSVIIACCFLALATVPISYLARLVHRFNRAAAYGSSARYLDHVVPRPRVVGLVLGQRSYVLSGRDLSIRIKSMSWNGYSSPAQWANAVLSSGITYIAVGPIERFDPKGWVNWLDSPESPFVRVSAGDPQDEPVLYRLSTSPASLGLRREGKSTRSEGSTRVVSRQ